MFSSITRQLKRASSVVKSVLAVVGTASATLDARLKPFLREGEIIDGIGPLMLLLARWIQSGHERLEEREVLQRRAERELKKLRLHRDHQQKYLYGMLLRIRKTFDEAFGNGMAAVYLGLEPRLSELEPLALRRVAREAVHILNDPGFTTPEPKVLGLWESPTQYAEQIEEFLDPFQTALDRIESQKREIEKAVKAKTDLLEKLRDRLTWSIRLFEAIYQLTGLGFHADRLRLTVASRPSTDKEKDEASEDGAAAADGAEEDASADAPDSASDG